MHRLGVFAPERSATNEEYEFEQQKPRGIMTRAQAPLAYGVHHGCQDNSEGEAEKRDKRSLRRCHIALADRDRKQRLYCRSLPSEQVTELQERQHVRGAGSKRQQRESDHVIVAIAA